MKHALQASMAGYHCEMWSARAEVLRRVAATSAGSCCCPAPPCIRQHTMSARQDPHSTWPTASTPDQLLDNSHRTIPLSDEQVGHELVQNGFSTRPPSCCPCLSPWAPECSVQLCPSSH